MATRRKVAPVERPMPDWEDYSRAGVQVRLKYERGTFTVQYEATPPGRTPYVAMWGGLAGHEMNRTPAADRVIWPKQRRQRSKP